LPVVRPPVAQTPVEQPPVAQICPEDESRLCSECSARPLSMCAGVPDSELRVLEQAITNLHIKPRGTILDEGEPALHMFNVTAGTVKVYKLLPDGRRQIIGFLMAGDFLGFAVRDSYAYSAEAVTPVRLCRFPRKKLDELFSRYPMMEKRLLRLAANELAVAQDLMLLLGRKTAKERLATFLLLLSDRAKRLGAAANPVALPMSRTDIADYLGLTTETVSRAFTQLRNSKLIRLDTTNQALLLDPVTLREITEGAA
jgi:CRP/FNR family transcriptional regulator, anaerobic regulatory protein